MNGDRAIGGSHLETGRDLRRAPHISATDNRETCVFQVGTNHNAKIVIADQQNRWHNAQEGAFALRKFVSFAEFALSVEIGK